MFPNHSWGPGGMWPNRINVSTHSSTYTPHATYTVRPDGTIYVGPPDPAAARAVQAQVEAGVQEMHRGMQVTGQEMQRGMQEMHQGMHQGMQSMFGSMDMGLMGGPQMGGPWNGGTGMPARGAMPQPPPPPPQAPIPPTQAPMPSPHMPMPQNPLGSGMMPPGPSGPGIQPGSPGT